MTKIHCDQCNQRIGVEVLIPSEAWERIARGSYALCPPCIDARLAEAGIECGCILFFRGKALRAQIEEGVRKAVMAWRPSQMQVERDGIVGNPMLCADSEVWQ